MNEAAVNHTDEGGYHDKCSFPLRNGDAFFYKSSSGKWKPGDREQRYGIATRGMELEFA